MKLATLGLDGQTSAARLEGDEYVLLDSPDVGAFLSSPADSSEGQGAIKQHDAVFAPLLTSPAHVFCVGLNYRSHVMEMGRRSQSTPRYSPSSARR